MAVLLLLLESWLGKMLFLDIYVLAILVIIGLVFYLGLAYSTGYAPKGLINKTLDKR